MDKFKTLYPQAVYTNKTNMQAKLEVSMTDSVTVQANATVTVATKDMIKFPPRSTFEFVSPTLEQLIAMGEMVAVQVIPMPVPPLELDLDEAAEEVAEDVAAEDEVVEEVTDETVVEEIVEDEPAVEEVEPVAAPVNQNKEDDFRNRHQQNHNRRR